MSGDITELKQQVAVLANSHIKMEAAMVSMADSLKALTKLEVQHAETQAAVARMFKSAADNEKRIRDIEVALPALKMSSNIFVRITTAVILMVVAAIVGSVLIK